MLIEYISFVCVMRVIICFDVEYPSGEWRMCMYVCLPLEGEAVVGD